MVCIIGGAIFSHLFGLLKAELGVNKLGARCIHDSRSDQKMAKGEKRKEGRALVL